MHVHIVCRGVRVKTVIIIFIITIFALLVYQIFSPLPKETKVPKKSQVQIAKKHKKIEKSEKPSRAVVPEIIQEMIAKNKKIITEQPSLADRIERIDGKLGDAIFIRILKEEAELEMWMETEGKFHLIQTYPICAYSGDLGPKIKEGDRQSPEGFYYVTKSRLNPNSRFHLSFNLGYPNAYDRAHGRTGSFLMVHGDCVSVGCYAMTDRKIEEIYELVEQALENGQKYVRVHIFPFRMSNENMIKHKNSKWYNFWENLQEGYKLFEKSSKPPNVKVEDKKYIFD